MSNDKFKDTAFIDIKGLAHFLSNFKETELLKYFQKDNINLATNNDILSIFNKNYEEPEIPEAPEKIIPFDFYFIANKPSTISFNNAGLYSGTATYSDNSIYPSVIWIGLSKGNKLQLNTGDIIGFKGDLSPNSSEGIGTFSITGDVSVHGNPEVLLADNILVNYAFSNLFNNCTGLTDASELEFNTTLKSYCYQYMFAGCTSLTKVADLPATTPLSSCYQSMFAGCTSLTEAPEIFLNNKGTGSSMLGIEYAADAMKFMFNGCSSLNYIKCHMSQLEIKIAFYTFISLNWVSGVSSTGTYYKPSDASIETGTSGIPEGWTVKTFTIDSTDKK